MEWGYDVHCRVVEMCANSEVSFPRFVEAFRELRQVLEQSLPRMSTFHIFGSLVSLGIPTSGTDLDVAVLHKSGARSSEVFEGFAKRLRGIGIPADELKSHPKARIPVLKRRVGPSLSHPLLMRGPSLVAFNAPVKTIQKLLRSKFPNMLWKVVKSTTEDCTVLFSSSDNLVTVLAYLFSKHVPSVVQKDSLLPALFRIDFDVIFHSYGIRNSWLLRYYVEQSFSLMIVLCYLRPWAKAVGIVNSRAGFLTSHAFHILVVYYFLRKGKVDFVDPEGIQVVTCPVEPQPLSLLSKLSTHFTDAHALDVGIHLASFLRFYLFEFDFENEVVSLSSPKVVTKEALGWTDGARYIRRGHCQHFTLAIEEPCEKNLSLGRNLEPAKVAFIRMQFLRALEDIASATDPSTTLLSYAADPCRRHSFTLSPPPADIIGQMTADPTMTYSKILEIFGSEALRLWEGDVIS